MMTFLLKGLLRDRHRSLFPVLVVMIGVMLTVLLHCWITGIMGDVLDFNARFSTGHVRVMTRAYAEYANQMPNDLALEGVRNLQDDLKKAFPEMDWVVRIRFAGLLDAPDAKGETRAQGPAMGLAVDLLSGNRSEIERLRIEKALVRGRMPKRPGEILISDEFAGKLGVAPGDSVTLLGSTMYGGMAMQNFTIAGTVAFGVMAMDRGAIIVDIADAQAALDMQDTAGEILGYFKNDFYNDQKAAGIAERFNAQYAGSEDIFAPVMKRLKEQNELAGIIDYMLRVKSVIVAVFILAMSIVLWNVGLIGGLRRYGEMGVRLAIGENKGHIYRAMIYESVCVGILGSIIGTAIGLGIAYYLQETGLDVSAFMKNTTMMVPTVYRAHITPAAYFIGFIPGLVSTVLGTMLSGIGIYKRQTAQLFKELEA